jgi:hypothetical protein
MGLRYHVSTLVSRVIGETRAVGDLHFKVHEIFLLMTTFVVLLVFSIH